MTPHPESARLARGTRRCLPLAIPWSGDTFRFAAPRWSVPDLLLSGEGAFRHGGRWCPPGLFRAVDSSLDPETALAEVLAQYRRFDWAIRDALPKLVAALEVRLQRVLDLTDGRVRRRLGLSLDRMGREPWWQRQAAGEEALTQAAGRVAWEAGAEGLLVPSAARPRGVNLVYFPGRRLPGSAVNIIHPEELPGSVP
ncbi:MAG TPA: RES family NAD+ phosphorylase [Gemmataceae bacterium]|nr:RES family NAD+ phosphorylase [Gemmataceae bacterium]